MIRLLCVAVLMLAIGGCGNQEAKSGGRPPADGGGMERAAPPDVVKGAKVRAWAADGTRLEGTAEVLEIRGNWVKIKYENGFVGWMNFDNVTHFEIVK
jgi:hypothetical protein